MHVTIITKTPVAGRVKTRLCPPCTPEQAAEVAAAALADTIDAVSAAVAGHPDAQPVILLEGEPGPWIPNDYQVINQRGDGLGYRLANGFAELGSGLMIGMDTPAAARWLPQAIAAVAAGNDTIGLTLDGGYWVIGLASVDSQVFDGVPMSQSHTGLSQLRQLHRLGRRVTLLPMGRDLDTVADLRAVANSAGDSRLARAARRVLV
jgi:uncharacterized protein